MSDKVLVRYLVAAMVGILGYFVLPAPAQNIERRNRAMRCMNTAEANGSSMTHPFRRVCLTAASATSLTAVEDCDAS